MSLVATVSLITCTATWPYIPYGAVVVRGVRRKVRTGSGEQYNQPGGGGLASAASTGPPGHRDFAGRGVCRDPQRNDHERGAAAADGRSRYLCAHGAMADDRVHADHGSGHSDNGLPAAAGLNPDCLLTGHGLVLSRDSARGALARVLATAACPHCPGFRYRGDDPAADDDRLDIGALRAPRCSDGEHHHCDLCRAGHWSNAVRAGSAVPVVAIHVRSGAADCAGFPRLWLATAGEHRSGGSSEARSALGTALDPGVRRRRLWPQPDGSRRLGTAGGSRLSRTRPGLHADLRMAPAPACTGRAQPVAGLACVQLSQCSA